MALLGPPPMAKATICCWPALSTHRSRLRRCRLGPLESAQDTPRAAALPARLGCYCRRRRAGFWKGRRLHSCTSCASLNLALNLHLELDNKSTSAQSRAGVGSRYGISASECHRRCIGADRSWGPMSDTVGPASGGPPSSDSHDSVATVKEFVAENVVSRRWPRCKVPSETDDAIHSRILDWWNIYGCVRFGSPLFGPLAWWAHLECAWRLMVPKMNLIQCQEGLTSCS